MSIGQQQVVLNALIARKKARQVKRLNDLIKSDKVATVSPRNRNNQRGRNSGNKLSPQHSLMPVQMGDGSVILQTSDRLSYPVPANTMN